MSDAQNNTQCDLNETLCDLIEQLVAYRTNTWTWVEQPHKLKDTKARQKELQAMGENLSALSVKFLKQKKGTVIPDNTIDANLRIVEIARSYET